MKILDCTLRDGGYYTQWDFSEELVKSYFSSFNKLPVDYLEIGYRSNPMKEYLGQFYYCPTYVMEQVYDLTQKKLVVILNEKDVKANEVELLLAPCVGLIQMVRLAIDPKNFERAIGLAEVIKKMGFEIGFNVMYMSKWKGQTDFLNLLPNIKELADYFYMVDSYGGVYPEDVKEIYSLVKEKVDVKMGFHGHNNLELALINTLTALECGVDMVDATVTGMGRGAGNLKTELLLTSLNSQHKIDLDYNALSKVVSGFSKLQSTHKWGTNLPYMVSGANSLPQKEVMEWVGKRYYSLNSIIRTLSNQSKGLLDNQELPNLPKLATSNMVMVVGGGDSVQAHTPALIQFLKANPHLAIIHSSSKNAKTFEKLNNRQFHCLAGNEGYRLEENFDFADVSNRMAILPPYPRTMGTYVPNLMKEKSYQLPAIDFTEKETESITAVVLQVVKELDAKTIYIVGYDGYHGEFNAQQMELFTENESLFFEMKEKGLPLCSLTPTAYQNLNAQSIYELI